MEECCTKADDRQDFQWKHNLLHVIHVTQNQRRRTVQYFGEESMDDHACEKNDRELTMTIVLTSAPACLEHHGENKGVNREHEKGIEEGPEQSHGRPLIAADYLALGHLEDQLPVPPQTTEQ
ncbi:hypothetical protein D3C78_584320 [compost metagenome]